MPSSSSCFFEAASNAGAAATASATAASAAAAAEAERLRNLARNS
jgi:hypothetical protein